MKVHFEAIVPDAQSSFRTLHINLPTSELRWEYHYHPEIELIGVIGGSGSRHVGYHKSPFQNGDLVLIGPNIPHSGFGLNSIDPHEEVVLQFREEIIQFPKEVEEAKAVYTMIELSKLGILFGEKTKKQILPQLKLMLEAEPSTRYMMLIQILFTLSKTKDYTLLNKQIMPYTIISRNKERLQSIFTYVEKNFSGEILVEEAAELAHLTLPAFCNFFKKSTLITFTDFINQYRINKACSLLLQGISVSDCCYQCGFNSLSYFNRMFNKYVGKSPSEFKKEYTIIQ